MQGFKALQVKLCEKSLASHVLYLKQHCVRDKVPEKPSNRTLFVVGVPPYYNEESVKELFSLFGNVQSVYLHKAPSSQIPLKENSKYFLKQEAIKGFKVAYVVFQKENHLNKALAHEEELVFPSKTVLTGIAKWNKGYNERFINKKEIEEEIKSFMDLFDEESDKKNKMDKDLSQSQDGWVTVTKKGRKPGFARKDSVAKHLKRRSEQQRRKKELTNFYTFQIKESKMKNLIALRKKFEEDKKKIAALREARRFKPF